MKDGHKKPLTEWCERMSNESLQTLNLAVNERVKLAFDASPYLFKHAEPVNSTRYDFEVTVECVETGIVQSFLIKYHEISLFTENTN